MNHHHGFTFELHPIKHLCLGRQIRDTFLHQDRVRTVEDNKLRWMKREPQIKRARALAEGTQLLGALFDLAVEPRQIGMRYVRRDIDDMRYIRRSFASRWSKIL